MTLFYFGTSQIFATMLAIVLSGIGFGDWLASRLARASQPSRWLPLIAFVSGGLVIGAYFGFARDLASRSAWYSSPLYLAVPLIFPVAMLSGSLFTLMGQALHDESGSDTRAVGYLSLVNTLGAMCGAWLSGFVLLPWLGIGAFVCRARGSVLGDRWPLPGFALEPLRTEFAISLQRA